MAANYKLVRNPDPANSDKLKPLHPRIKSLGTLSIEQLADRAQGRSSLSPATIKSALLVIADLLQETLREGYNVNLNNIGYFSVSLKSRPVMEKNEIRSESVHFSHVNFRCSQELKDKLSTMEVTRAQSVTVPNLSQTEKELRLKKHFEQKLNLTTTEYMNLTYCSRQKALKELKSLVQEDKITKIGSKNATQYLNKSL
ncbi:hypothetical protein A9168_16055 [Macellibacteroides sp. HH-ZS]|nr:hypothetical protein A9168_16055 [Macellibacteroides sp. HH-ZS]